MNDIPKEVIERYTELSATLIHLNTVDSDRARSVRDILHELEHFYPQLERQRIQMMQHAILGEE